MFRNFSFLFFLVLYTYEEYIMCSHFGLQLPYKITYYNVRSEVLQQCC